MKRLQFRQGDVLLLQCDQLPEKAIAASNKERIVLAYGEVTGHAHAISALNAEEFSINNDRYLNVHDFSTLVHEEHAPIIISPGLYKIIQQMEYDPAAIRYVED